MLLFTLDSGNMATLLAADGSIRMNRALSLIDQGISALEGTGFDMENAADQRDLIALFIIKRSPSATSPADMSISPESLLCSLSYAAQSRGLNSGAIEVRLSSMEGSHIAERVSTTVSLNLSGYGSVEPSHVFQRRRNIVSSLAIVGERTTIAEIPDALECLNCFSPMCTMTTTQVDFQQPNEVRPASSDIAMHHAFELFSGTGTGSSLFSSNPSGAFVFS